MQKKSDFWWLFHISQFEVVDTSLSQLVPLLIEEKTLRDVAERTSELIEKHLRSDVIDLNTGIK